MDNWKRWSSTYLAGGCPILSSIVEYDDRPGEVRDYVQNLQAQMIHSFEKALSISIEEGDLIKETHVTQVAYEIYSNMIGYHIYGRLLNHKDSEKLFQNSYQRILGPIKGSKEDI